MTQGISIHVGLNSIDPAHYGTNGQLRGCENDAKAMMRLANLLNYKSSLLLTKDATSARVLAELIKASQELNKGDILLLTYSGHGAQIPDTSGEENDGYDETWCLYDRMLIDDELYNMWAKFKEGVRIILLSDSCHSGTVSKMIEINGSKTVVYNNNMIFRCLPPDISLAVFHKFSYIYNGIKSGIPREIKNELTSSVLLISGCQDNQLSGDSVDNGTFTSALLQIWNNGSFRGTYRSFCQQIISLMPPTQTPNYYFIGLDNPDFEKQNPFSIDGPYRMIDNDEVNNMLSWRKISWKVDLDDNILCKFSEMELNDYLNRTVINPMVDGYKKFKTLSNQIIFTTKGGDLNADIHCDTHGGGCDIHVGGSIHF